MPRRKNPAAVALGKKRWKGTSATERSKAGRAAIAARWKNTNEKERKKIGQQLAAARAAARKRKKQ